MRQLIMRVTIAICALAALAGVASCNRANYMMFEDGDFDGTEFVDEIYMHNNEVELDDLDR